MESLLSIQTTVRTNYETSYTILGTFIKEKKTFSHPWDMYYCGYGSREICLVKSQQITKKIPIFGFNITISDIFQDTIIKKFNLQRTRQIIVKLTFDCAQRTGYIDLTKTSLDLRFLIEKWLERPTIQTEILIKDILEIDNWTEYCINSWEFIPEYLYHYVASCIIWKSTIRSSSRSLIVSRQIIDMENELNWQRDRFLSIINFYANKNKFSKILKNIGIFPELIHIIFKYC